MVCNLDGLCAILFPLELCSCINKRKKAEDNPWEVGTLEWTIPSPAPHYNFDEIPVVKCGPHELGNPALGDGKDFQYQTEELAKA